MTENSLSPGRNGFCNGAQGACALGAAALARVLRTLVGGFILFLVVADWANAVDAVKIYPAPAGAHLGEDLRLRVRVGEASWQEVPVYKVEVDFVEGVVHRSEIASLAYLDFSGTIEVQVEYLKSKPERVKVRPKILEIPVDVRGTIATFFLKRSAYVSVECDGDIRHNLHLFADSLESLPQVNRQDCLYFGPGIHELPEGGLRVKSNQTVYLDGGSILRGTIICDQVENVAIVGRGYFDVKGGISVRKSRKVRIDGVVATRGLGILESREVSVKNYKCITHGGWGDGLDVYCSEGVEIDNVFFRTSDDCIAVYAHRRSWFGDVRNVRVKNATLWADVAHPILVGTHGNTANPEVIEDLVFENIDILDHCEAQLDYQGCMAINVSDSNLVRRARFENIRVEDFRRGQLVNLRVTWNHKYATSPGRGIEDVTFRNITYSGTHASPSVIAGYDEARMVRNITFENLQINGVLISDQMKKPSWYKTSDMANFFVGEHVESVVFR